MDSTLLEAWWKADPGAAWQQYAGKAHVFGYKVHTVLCRQANLPVYVLVTPAIVHDSLVGWLIVLVAALLYGFQVLVVYADAAYFDRRFFGVVFHDYRWVVHCTCRGGLGPDYWGDDIGFRVAVSPL